MTLTTAITYACTYHGCKEQFDLHCDLYSHKREAHRSNVPRPLSMKRNEPPRTASGKYICAADESCQAEFDRKCEWGKHMDKHDRPYHCNRPECAKLSGFTYSGGLLRHEREVHKMHGNEVQHSRHESNRTRASGSEFSHNRNPTEHVGRVHRSGMPAPLARPRASGLPKQKFKPEWPGLVLQPESREISQDQLAAEVKIIYTGLTMVETKCIHIDRAQAATPRSESKITDEHWQAMIALHRTLLHEHHDFFLASQHPSASPALKRLAARYSMPARMWKHGIHSFLELLRHRLPESFEYMSSFIYLAYQMMALLYETVDSFHNTWIECPGDLGRYRMAIEDEHVRDREIWAGVARSWYNKAADTNPAIGRLWHHLAILARPHMVQQLYLYNRSLTSVVPFINARESIVTIFDPITKANSKTAVGSTDLAPLKSIALSSSYRSLPEDWMLRDIDSTTTQEPTCATQEAFAQQPQEYGKSRWKTPSNLPEKNDTWRLCTLLSPLLRHANFLGFFNLTPLLLPRVAVAAAIRASRLPVDDALAQSEPLGATAPNSVFDIATAVVTFCNLLYTVLSLVRYDDLWPLPRVIPVAFNLFLLAMEGDQTGIFDPRVRAPLYVTAFITTASYTWGESRKAKRKATVNLQATVTPHWVPRDELFWVVDAFFSLVALAVILPWLSFANITFAPAWPLAAWVGATAGTYAV